MALHIDRNGVQKEINLKIDDAISRYGDSPVDCTFFGMSSILCDEYECKRLGDGRILFYTEYDDPDLPGGSILLTQEESVHVMTRQEADANLLERVNRDERSAAGRMTMLFDEAERSLNKLLFYINELGYEPPGTKFAEYLQNAHRITKSQRTFEVELDGKRVLLPVSKLDTVRVVNVNPQLTVVCEVDR